MAGLVAEVHAAAPGGACLRCPQCRARLIQKSADGMVRVRTQVLVFDQAGAASAICRECKCAVPVDVTLGSDLRKSLDERSAETRLVLRNS